MRRRRQPERDSALDDVVIRAERVDLSGWQISTSAGVASPYSPNADLAVVEALIDKIARRGGALPESPGF